MKTAKEILEELIRIYHYKSPGGFANYLDEHYALIPKQPEVRNIEKLEEPYTEYFPKGSGYAFHPLPEESVHKINEIIEFLNTLKI